MNYNLKKVNLHIAKRKLTQSKQYISCFSVLLSAAMAKARPVDEKDFGFFDLPIIFTPLTKITDHWGTAQKGPCAAREIDWARCATRVGEMRARIECKPFLDDFMECAHHIKSVSSSLQ